MEVLIRTLVLQLKLLSEQFEVLQKAGAEHVAPWLRSQFDKRLTCSIADMTCRVELSGTRSTRSTLRPASAPR